MDRVNYKNMTPEEVYAAIDETEQPEPTSRCLPAPWDDGVEYLSRGTIGGKKAVIRWYFDAKDMIDADGESISDEDYPWDFDSVSEILVEIEPDYWGLVYGLDVAGH